MTPTDFENLSRLSLCFLCIKFLRQRTVEDACPYKDLLTSLREARFSRRFLFGVVIENNYTLYIVYFAGRRPRRPVKIKFLFLQ